jgi:hypothetical protein
MFRLFRTYGKFSGYKVFIPVGADVDRQEYFIFVCEPTMGKSVFRSFLLIDVLQVLAKFIEQFSLFVRHLRGFG